MLADTQRRVACLQPSAQSRKR